MWAQAGGYGATVETLYAVIFSNTRTHVDGGYGAMAARMEELARAQPGLVDVESARRGDGFGITVSYWRTLDDVACFRALAEHLAAQAMGREAWYASYRLVVAKVEREVRWTRDGGA